MRTRCVPLGPLGANPIAPILLAHSADGNGQDAEGDRFDFISTGPSRGGDTLVTFGVLVLFQEERWPSF